MEKSKSYRGKMPSQTPDKPALGPGDPAAFVANLPPAARDAASAGAARQESYRAPDGGRESPAGIKEIAKAALNKGQMRIDGYPIRTRPGINIIN